MGWYRGRTRALRGLGRRGLVLAGFTANAQALGIGCGLLLTGWGLYHWGYRHRHRVRIGMQTGFAGLFFWSFLMGVMVHRAGMLAVTAIAYLVHEWVGLGILSRAWINLDAVWTAALLAAGGPLVLGSL